MLRPTRIAVMLAVATIALAAVAAASASQRAKAGGTINVSLATDLDFTDPALAYYAPSWELEYATQLKLFNYRDANGATSSELIPEAAAGLPRVTPDGKTYDFNVTASWTKFSNGEPVTAASFAAALNRDADPHMQSPAQSFMSDIVGATDVFSGKAQTISGVQVKGSHLIVHLTKAAPDFVARMAMPFFSAVPKSLPHDPNGVDNPASAGPYYIASRVPNRTIVVKRNPYYKGPRPHNVAAISYTVGDSLDAILLKVRSAASDYAADGVPPASYSELAGTYGINKSQLWVEPTLAVRYEALNTAQPLFKNNPQLRKAVNYAIDRHALVAQGGYLAGKRSDQILPPGIAGFRDASIYPLKGADIATAKKLAAGHLGSGSAVLYTCNVGACPLRAQIIQYDLGLIGIKVDVKTFSRAVQLSKEGILGEPFDIADEGWGADYADPYDFVNVLLDGASIHANNNSNFAYFNDPHYNKLMQQAALLSGPSRYTTYGSLDIDISKNAAPWASWQASNLRLFVSKRFGCFTYNNIYGNDFAAACVK